MFVAKLGVDSPEQFEIITFGADGDNLAVHGFGIGCFSVGRNAEAFTIFEIVVAPDLTACVAVDGSHIAVGGNDNHFVGGDDRDAVAGRKEVDVFAVVPLPDELTVGSVEQTKISVPSAESNVVAVDCRLGLTIVENAVEVPKEFVFFYVPGLECF